jgi:hypothetical protein
MVNFNFIFKLPQTRILRHLSKIPPIKTWRTC